MGKSSASDIRGGNYGSLVRLRFLLVEIVRRRGGFEELRMNAQHAHPQFVTQLLRTDRQEVAFGENQ